jgi:hypothetical protein
MVAPSELKLIVHHTLRGLETRGGLLMRSYYLSGRALTHELPALDVPGAVSVESFAVEPPQSSSPDGRLGFVTAEVGRAPRTITRMH